MYLRPFREGALKITQCFDDHTVVAFDNLLKRTQWMSASRDRRSKRAKKTRVLFTAEEDELLRKAMEQSFVSWVKLAESIPGRTARQCRDRWVNYLAPQNRNGPWTPEEDTLLWESYRTYGPQWARIARFLNGRSENNVKNRWYAHVRHQHPQRESDGEVPLDDMLFDTSKETSEDTTSNDAEEPKVRSESSIVGFLGLMNAGGHVSTVVSRPTVTRFDKNGRPKSRSVIPEIGHFYGQ